MQAVGHARRSGFAVSEQGSRWSVRSAGLTWLDFILYEEDRFGCCEENGREGGREASVGVGTQSGRGPGSSWRAGRNEEARWALPATRRPKPLLVLRSRHPSSPAVKLLAPKNLDREPNPQTGRKSKQSRGPKGHSFRTDVLFFQSTPFMGSTSVCLAGWPWATAARGPQPLATARRTPCKSNARSTANAVEHKATVQWWSVGMGNMHSKREQERNLQKPEARQDGHPKVHAQD